jgi:hypothetical protein
VTTATTAPLIPAAVQAVGLAGPALSLRPGGGVTTVAQVTPAAAEIARIVIDDVAQGTGLALDMAPLLPGGPLGSDAPEELATAASS